MIFWKQTNKSVFKQKPIRNFQINFKPLALYQFDLNYIVLGASLVTQLVKIHLQRGRPGFDPWVGKIHGRREWLPTSVFWPGEFHGLYV